MPNRGKLEYNEKQDYYSKAVYNTVKQVLDADLTKKGDKFRLEKALKHFAHKVQDLMQKHAEEPDVASTIDTLERLELHVQHPDVPRTLGRQKAREIVEILLGQAHVLQDTEDYVVHHEKPGMPAPINLWTTSDDDEEHFALSDYSSGDESNRSIVDSKACPSSVLGSTYQLPEPIHLIQYSRCPKEFLVNLMQNDVLTECRNSLTNHSYDWVLKSGAKAFVRPSQYEAVVQAVKGLGLKRWHVIISGEFLPSLEDALGDLGKGVKVKRGEKLPPVPMVVKRSFLEVQLPSSLRSDPNSDPVTASTTDAHPRHGVLPRRV